MLSQRCRFSAGSVSREGRSRPGLEFLSRQNVERLVECRCQLARLLESLQEVRDRGAIINEQIIPIQDIKLNRAVYKFSLAATILLLLSFFTGLFGINLSGLPGARSDAAFGCFPPPVRCFWPCPSSSRKGRGCYRSDGAVKLGTPPPFRRNPSA